MSTEGKEKMGKKMKTESPSSGRPGLIDNHRVAETTCC